MSLHFLLCLRFFIYDAYGVVRCVAAGIFNVLNSSVDLVVTHPAALLFALGLVVLVKAALDRQACPSPILTLMCRLKTYQAFFVRNPSKSLQRKCGTGKAVLAL